MPGVELNSDRRHFVYCKQHYHNVVASVKMYPKAHVFLQHSIMFHMVISRLLASNWILVGRLELIPPKFTYLTHEQSSAYFPTSSLVLLRPPWRTRVHLTVRSSYFVRLLNSRYARCPVKSQRPIISLNNTGLCSRNQFWALMCD